MKTINYVLIGVLVIFVVMIFALQPKYEETIPEDAELMFCEVDADCVPFPAECHTKTCINQEYAHLYEEPEACTMIFDSEAAYTPECCVCINNVCLNQNLGRDIEDIE